MIEVRRATYEDIPKIMQFMDEHWKPGNILAKNREFFEWQFLDGEKVNMFIGVDHDTGKMYGMVGAVVYSRKPNPDISSCTWQTIKSSNPMLGIELSNYMLSQLHPRYNCSAGLTNKSIRINELMGGVPTKMDHYYRLADRLDYRIADVKNKVIPYVKDTGYCLEQIFCVDDMKQIITEEMLAGSVMSKDYAYIEKRYFEHPVYQYDKWKVVDRDGNSASILVTRDETALDSKICKIVDYYGDWNDFKRITAALDRLMEERGYEFIDIYSFGVPVDLYEQAGFCCCDETSENIIPNYFHPFERRNITLKMMNPFVPEMKLLRGDGDQDRPC